jgi:uncharacterized protein YndB with AHSA1/START domain
MTRTEAFSISRTLVAPRELVFACFTTGEHMANWFGPQGSRITHSVMDFREGGIYHYAMEMGDAPAMWGRFLYRTILRPSRISLISCFSNPEGGISRAPFFDGKWPLEMESTYSFDDLPGGKTRITVSWQPLGASEDELATFDSNRASMNGGWSGTLDRLEALAHSLEK